MLRVFRPPSFLLLSVQIFGVAQQAVFSSIAVCSSHKLLRKQVLHSSGGVLCGACFGVELWAFGTILPEWRFGIIAEIVFVCV